MLTTKEIVRQLRKYPSSIIDDITPRGYHRKIQAIMNPDYDGTNFKTSPIIGYEIYYRLDSKPTAHMLGESKQLANWPGWYLWKTVKIL